MGIVIGMDEAGYGPRLGPLVVTATVWEVPDDPRHVDLWDLLAEVVTRTPGRDEERLHLADSKLVYNPGKGLSSLERTVLAALGMCGHSPTRFRELWSWLAADDGFAGEGEPWFDDGDLPLPHACADAPAELAARWQRCCDRHGLRLKAIRSDVVLTERFNRLTRDCGTKGAALSSITFRLLREVWDPDDAAATLVIADKHGGRNRYDELLDAVLDGQMIFRQQETAALSVYRVGSTELRFQPQADATHLPVALASMVCKYVRELAMALFNRFWVSHIPELKPTAGYNNDASRFCEDIAEMQTRLGISSELLWRER
jgi:hypothetical protein